jgi:hypothetical protein
VLEPRCTPVDELARFTVASVRVSTKYREGSGL